MALRAVLIRREAGVCVQIRPPNGSKPGKPGTAATDPAAAISPGLVTSPRFNTWTVRGDIGRMPPSGLIGIDVQLPVP